jgi:fructosamine-3-kinase
MSGSYVQSELNAEFGHIPPSFLPLGNKRLFQHQIKLAPDGCQVYLSIPESYEINDVDFDWLHSHNVSVIKTACQLNLGQAFVACLNLIDSPLTSPLHLLFGDTLFGKLPEGDDLLAVSEVKSNYQWSSVDNNNIGCLDQSDDSSNVVCGYFKFSQPRNLIRNITQETWDFIKGINRYKKETGLSQVASTDWYDFGHVNTYYHSKAAFTTQRSFNELKINSSFIEKSSVKNKKIRAEANWFNCLPPMLKSYTPQYLGSNESIDGKFSYRLEYLHNTALNELFVFSEMPNIIWKNILEHCLRFIQDCNAEIAPKNSISQSLDELFGSKTLDRLCEFSSARGFNLSDKWHYNNEYSVSIEEMLAVSQQYLPTQNITPTLMHGDFCFSNILYDFRADRIKTIDPRGLNGSDEMTLYGDTYYDLAKLSHSILGMYDWIVAGYHNTHFNWDKRRVFFSISGELKHKETQTMFIEMVGKTYGLNAINLYAMQLQLFLSMLPLHTDDPYRQEGLFANAFRIYQIIKRYAK